MLGFLKRNCSKEISSNALKVLYLALVRSHLGYCSQIWAPQSVIRNILLVESVQRRATKFIFKLSNKDHFSYRDRLVQLNLLTLSYWLEYLDLVFFFKCKSDDNSIKLDKYMTFCTGTSRRSSTDLYLRLKFIPKTSTFRDSYFPRIVQMWNALPDDVKSCTSLPSFKYRLKNLFFNRLRVLFDQDNIRSYKLICPKCRHSNALNLCSCQFRLTCNCFV